jgi:uncharacterized protein GlcG (DUF336 family)
MVLRAGVSGSARVQGFSTTNAWHQRCDETRTFLPQASLGCGRQNRPMKLDQALAVVRFVVDAAPGAVSVFVADTHGEVVAAATMDGAAPDTRLNAQRKAYTAARSDARATSELAAKVADDVSGLPGEVDEDLARRAIAAAGLGTVPGEDTS